MTAEEVPTARATVNISFWLSPEQKSVLDSYRKRVRTPQTTVIDDALREYFAAREIEWPDVMRRV